MFQARVTDWMKRQMTCKQDRWQHSKARRLLTFAGYRSREQDKWPSREEWSTRRLDAEGVLLLAGCDWLFVSKRGPGVLVAGWRGQDEQALRRCRQGPVLVQARCWLLLVPRSTGLGTSQLIFLAFLAKARDLALPWDYCAQYMWPDLQLVVMTLVEINLLEALSASNSRPAGWFELFLYQAKTLLPNWEWRRCDCPQDHGKLRCVSGRWSELGQCDAADGWMRCVKEWKGCLGTWKR